MGHNPAMRSKLLIGLLALAPAFSLAQEGMSGQSQYTSQRSLSGLSGGGFGVLPDGSVRFGGAIALSTPIGYTIGRRTLVFSAANLSYDRTPRFIETLPGVNDTNPKANGTASGVLGMSTRHGNFMIGGLMTTGDLDTSLNLQWSPKQSVAGWGIAFGVQDAFSTAGANTGPIQQTLGSGNSRSYFLAATRPTDSRTWVTVGFGSQRFSGPFGNVSRLVSPGIQAIGEFDGFGFNLGTAFHIGSGSLAQRPVDWTATASLVRGRYFTWVLSANY